jgi:hypothetical protein
MARRDAGTHDRSAAAQTGSRRRQQHSFLWKEAEAEASIPQTPSYLASAMLMLMLHFLASTYNIILWANKETE